MKRLSALAPDLDIFGSRYVLRDDAGWQLTEAGQAFLATLEMPTQVRPEQTPSPEIIVTLSVPRQLPAPPLRLVADNSRKKRRARGDDPPSSRSAVA
jgi:hypothetical protein